MFRIGICLCVKTYFNNVATFVTPCFYVCYYNFDSQQQQRWCNTHIQKKTSFAQVTLWSKSFYSALCSISYYPIQYVYFDIMQTMKTKVSIQSNIAACAQHNKRRLHEMMPFDVYFTNTQQFISHHNEVYRYLFTFCFIHKNKWTLSQ